MAPDPDTRQALRLTMSFATEALRRGVMLPEQPANSPLHGTSPLESMPNTSPSRLGLEPTRGKGSSSTRKAMPPAPWAAGHGDTSTSAAKKLIKMRCSERRIIAPAAKPAPSTATSSTPPWSKSLGAAAPKQAARRPSQCKANSANRKRSLLTGLGSGAGAGF